VTNQALAELVEAATTSLQECSSGGSLCALGRTGERAAVVKYAEGRWAALREVQRACRADADLAAVVQQLAQPWIVHQERLRARGVDGDWLAYRRGGVDALTELAEAYSVRLIGP
jgi:hypothetical protein